MEDGEGEEGLLLGRQTGEDVKMCAQRKRYMAPQTPLAAFVCASAAGRSGENTPLDQTRSETAAFARQRGEVCEKMGCFG